MKMENSDLPAMPLDSATCEKLDNGDWYEWLGLTKREHFAGLAMQKIMENSYSTEVHSVIAEKAVSLADALLEALDCDI